MQKLHGTYCHKTGTRPPSCGTPRQPTIYTTKTEELAVNVSKCNELQKYFINKNSTDCGEVGDPCSHFMSCSQPEATPVKILS